MGTLCPILCHSRLKILAAEVLNCPPLLFHADVRIPFHHGAKDVPGERHHGRIGSLRLCQPGNERMAQIVEAATDLCRPNTDNFAPRRERDATLQPLCREPLPLARCPEQRQPGPLRSSLAGP